MAPSTYLIARQEPAGNSTETPTTAADVPECVLTCMASGDLDSCASPTDYTCLCQSTVYSSSVLSCWTANCTPTETEVGVEYSNYACQAFGVTPNPDATNSTTNSTTADPTTTNRLTAPTLTDATSPELYNKAFLNVQAIMSSICGALLLAAICLGLLACRSRIRRDRELAQRSTWTGVGTTMYGTDTKLGQKSHLFSRNTNGGSNANNLGVTSSNFGGETTMSHTHPFGGFSGPGINRTTSTTIDEMMEDDEDEKKYGISKAYRGTRVSVNRGFRGTGFTNRLTTTDADSAVGGLPGQESWEMTLKSGPSSSNGSIDKRDDYAESTVVADSPTDSVTRMGDSTIDLGSTTQLNRVPYDGNRGNAI